MLRGTTLLKLSAVLLLYCWHAMELNLYTGLIAQNIICCNIYVGKAIYQRHSKVKI